MLTTHMNRSVDFVQATHNISGRDAECGREKIGSRAAILESGCPTVSGHPSVKGQTGRLWPRSKLTRERNVHEKIACLNSRVRCSRMVGTTIPTVSNHKPSSGLIIDRAFYTNSVSP